MLNPVVSASQAVGCRASGRCSTKAIKCPPTTVATSRRQSTRRTPSARQVSIITNLGSSPVPMNRFFLFGCSALAAFLLILASILIPVRFTSAEAPSISATAAQHLPSDSPSDSIVDGLSALLSGSLDEKLLGGGGEPRQYFKLRVISSPSKSARKKKAHARASGNKSEQKQKITNAALKKLLNQSLLRAANSNSTFFNSSSATSGLNGSNFRLVFVQKAPVLSPPSSSTAAPQPSSSDIVGKDASSSFLEGRKAPLSSSSSGSSNGNESSLSKQLAETLISSTLNMAFNSPSIGSIASKLAVKGFETMMANRNSSASSSILEGKVSREHAPLSTSINSKTRQPSKVYNLPIKFVADGQPYHITVLSALKKHLLATAASSSGSSVASKKSHHKSHHSASAMPVSLKVSKHADQQSKHRKLEQLHKKKESHGNSRLIYLPLKYFNNGRISKVIINSSSGSSSSSSSASSSSSSNSLKRKGK